MRQGKLLKIDVNTSMRQTSAALTWWEQVMGGLMHQSTDNGVRKDTRISEGFKVGIAIRGEGGKEIRR